ncbi:DUF4127 family protein [uncultured Selenomonas sp.]|uniref:DUF4127 family protein n=1 Tax=uncultured Selenomonas sp. TaxID=159275 RepID=UPI0028D5A44C|nr:DUF4127 family protein [uncultured Selenomonas sp.]
MQKTYKILALLLALAFLVLPAAEAGKKDKEEEMSRQKRIMFIPHDNRPISDKQTADVVRELGYEVIVPPDDMLGSRTDLGHPEELWTWAEENASGVSAAVISSDSMLYGSLVGSRKHGYTRGEIVARLKNFEDFRAAHPALPLYVFGSIMRTPRSGEASGSEEPGYYKNYGADIFRYTLLTDKQEVEGLTSREKKEYAFLKELIPEKSMEDWMSRRTKNFAANEKLIDYTKSGVFDYFVLGRDDNAPYSQTHMEGRKLLAYSAGLGSSKFQTMSGIDEVGLLLLSRAVNNIEHKMPFIHVRYNKGTGGRTVPAYSDEHIQDSVRAAATAAGAVLIQRPEKSEYVLLVNTNPNGKTYEANDRTNDGKVRDGTQYFLDLLKDYIAKGYPVGIADVAYANGADNALMEGLKREDLLFKLRAYAGWNTPTNSTGFAVAEGLLAERMTDDARDSLLLTRYLDDWAYQANVRNKIARQLGWLRGSGVYMSLDDKILGVQYRADRMMREFADNNLPPLPALREIKVNFPWNRMFEADIVTAQ